MKLPPDRFLFPTELFAGDCYARVQAGEEILAASSVAIVGLARDCAARLEVNLWRCVALGNACREWRVHVEENDSQDGTQAVLSEFGGMFPNVTHRSRTLGRKHRGGEFAGARTQDLAEYRSACQQWVREHATAADFVIVVDFDQWGGWSHFGVLNGIGWLGEIPEACGMASVSLLESDIVAMRNGETFHERTWLHYDAWALRLNSYWDDYTAGEGGWKHQWLPPIGSHPVPVCSAFGGLCIYRTADYLEGRYSGEDCEHVTFHRSIEEASGGRVYLNPSQRCVMQWLEDSTNGGKHGNDLHTDVPG